MDGGDPGPGRRLRGEGLGPESTSGLSPPPGFRTTGVDCPRPRPPPHTDPFRLLPGGHGRPRGLGRNARSAEERPSRRPPPAPPPPRRRRRQRRLRHKAGTRPRLGLAAPPHHPGPQPAAGGLRLTLATPPRLPDASSRRVLRASFAFRSRRLSAQYRKIRPGNRRATVRAPPAPFLFRPPAALGPSPGAGDTSKPGTMADAAWLRASAPLRGLLSRDCTGGARGACLACAHRRAEGRGLRRHKAHRPAHVTPRFVTPERGT